MTNRKIGSGETMAQSQIDLATTNIEYKNDFLKDRLSDSDYGNDDKSETMNSENENTKSNRYNQNDVNMEEEKLNDVKTDEKMSCEFKDDYYTNKIDDTEEGEETTDGLILKELTKLYARRNVTLTKEDFDFYWNYINKNSTVNNSPVFNRHISTIERKNHYSDLDISDSNDEKKNSNDDDEDDEEGGEEKGDNDNLNSLSALLSSSSSSSRKNRKKIQKISIRRVSKKKISNDHDKLKWKAIKNYINQFNSNEYLSSVVSIVDDYLQRSVRTGLYTQKKYIKTKCKNKAQYSTLMEWIDDKSKKRKWVASLTAMYRRHSHLITDVMICLILSRLFNFLPPGMKIHKPETILTEGIYQSTISIPDVEWESFLAAKRGVDDDDDDRLNNLKEVFSILYEYKTRYIDGELLCPFGLTSNLDLSDDVEEFLEANNYSIFALFAIEQHLLNTLVIKKEKSIQRSEDASESMDESTRRKLWDIVERDVVRVTMSFQSFVEVIQKQYKLSQTDIIDMMLHLKIIPDLKDKNVWTMSSPIVVQNYDNNCERYANENYERVFDSKKTAKFTTPRVVYDIELLTGKTDETGSGKIYYISVWKNNKQHLVTIKI